MQHVFGNFLRDRLCAGNRLCNDLNDAEAQICCYGMEAIVLGVVTETRASNATKEDAAEGVEVNRNL